MSEVNTSIAAKLDITAIRKDTWELELEFRDKDDNLIDFTGATIEMRGSSSEDSFELTLINGGIQHVSLGVIKIVRNATTLKSIEYDYDLVVQFPSGDVKTYLYGVLKVNKNQ